MKVTIRDRALTLRERLSDRLELVEHLRCTEHDRPVEAVTIHGRENGWFESTWITCCEGLEQRATAIVKERC
jgi:hypothetical protein